MARLASARQRFGPLRTASPRLPRDACACACECVFFALAGPCFVEPFANDRAASAGGAHANGTAPWRRHNCVPKCRWTTDCEPAHAEGGLFSRARPAHWLFGQWAELAARIWRKTLRLRGGQTKASRRYHFCFYLPFLSFHHRPAHCRTGPLALSGRQISKWRRSRRVWPPAS